MDELVKYLQERKAQLIVMFLSAGNVRVEVKTVRGLTVYLSHFLRFDNETSKQIVSSLVASNELEEDPIKRINIEGFDNRYTGDED